MRQLLFVLAAYYFTSVAEGVFFCFGRLRRLASCDAAKF